MHATWGGKKVKCFCFCTSRIFEQQTWQSCGRSIAIKEFKIQEHNLQ